MAYRSPEEVEQQHLEAMGPSLGPIYHALYTEVVWLHDKWQQYRKLFDSRESLDVLNAAAGFLFWVVGRVLWDDALLHLARLVDPATSFGRADKANVTLQALPALIPDSSLASRVEELVQDATQRCAFATDHRNRRIAHRDLALALSGAGSVKPLAPASRAAVEAALTSIRAALGMVHGQYFHVDPQFAFQFLSPPVTGADALLFHLQRSLGSEGTSR